jgi:hypothetical protein
MASNREERERLRAERLASQSATGSSERRRLLAGYFVAGLLTLAVVGGLIAVVIPKDDDPRSGGGLCGDAHIQAETGSFISLDEDCREGTPPPELKQGDLALAAKEAGCELRVNLPDEGNSHVPNSAEVNYKTNPPTSGDHNANPVADGAYTTPLRDVSESSGEELNIRNILHSLEHGRVEIQYSTDLPESDQLALKGVFDEDPGGMILFPNDLMPYQVAATAWTNLLACPAYNEAVLDAIRDFRDIYRGQGPEDVATNI